MPGIKIDLVLYNANVITVAPDQARAEAIAVANGRFVAVGSNDDITHLTNGYTKRVDLKGKIVLPGFIDAHCHPAMAGRNHLRSVACDLRTTDEILEALRERAANTPPGQWVRGFLYDDMKYPSALTFKELDAAVPQHPVFIAYRGGHTAVANSLAFQLAGVRPEDEDPPGGRFVRDPQTRQMNGRLDDTAREPFYQIMPMKFSRDDCREGAKLISKMMARTGITSVGDAALNGHEDLLAYQDAHHAGELDFRVYCFVNYKHINQLIEAGVRTRLGDEWVRVGAMKLFCDGSISERTACLSTPYCGSADYHGLLVMDEEELHMWARKAHEAGWQIGIHANGDVAVGKVLNVYERLQRELPRKDPRYRIEHCTVVNPDLVKRIRALNAIPVPFSCYVSFHGEKMHLYGRERLNWMFAMRSFLDAGLLPPEASDYTASPFNPVFGLQAQVTRTDPKGNVWGPTQKISIEEAIRVATIHGAYASFEESVKGSIEAGKLADLVVLSDDPTKVDPNALADLRCERTMLGGRWVYEA